MKKFGVFVLLAAIVAATCFSGQIVATAETYFAVDDGGNLYRVREGRSRAFCDGTIVTRFRARRVASCNDSFSGCDSGYSGCDSDYSGCDNSDRGSCDRGRRRVRGVRFFQGFSGCDSGYSSSCND